MKQNQFLRIFPPCKESNSFAVKYDGCCPTLYKSKVCSVNINCIDVGTLEMFQKMNSLPLSISNGNNILVCGKQKHMAGRNFTAWSWWRDQWDYPSSPDGVAVHSVEKLHLTNLSDSSTPSQLFSRKLFKARKRSFMQTETSAWSQTRIVLFLNKSYLRGPEVRTDNYYHLIGSYELVDKFAVSNL